MALAAPILDEGLAVWRETGNAWGLGTALQSAGSLARTQGKPDRASALFRESLALWSRVGGARGIAESLEGLAGVFLDQGNPVPAARLYAAGASIRERVGAARQSHRRAIIEGDLAALRQRLGESGFDAAWAKGRGMTMEETMSTLATASP